MRLECRVVVPERGVDVELSIADGETVALLGPNGAGKSTVMNAIVGIVPTAGYVRIGDRDVTDVPVHRRDVALLAQDALLFPHLTALDNVAFGPRSARSGRAAARTIAQEWLARVDAATLASRKPHQLSGGQQQRVAVARALATEPHVLLLDEPMAALDVTAVPAMRQLLRTELADRPAVIVTHDVLDALTLADRVVVIEDGQVAETGASTEVLTRPRSRFAADLAGLNLLPTDGAVPVVGEPDLGGRPGIAVFRPSAVSVHRTRPDGSPRNVWPAVITALEPQGDRVRVRTDVAAADVTPAAVAELDLAPGVEVVLTVKATEVAVHPL